MGDVSLRPEARDVAVGETHGFDALLDGVQVRQRLGDPALRTSLNIDLTCASNYEPPNRPNQQVTRVGDGRYRIKLLSALGPAVTDRERREALVSTASVDLAVPAIEQTAKQVTRDAKTRSAAVSALLRFVDEKS